MAVQTLERKGDLAKVTQADTGFLTRAKADQARLCSSLFTHLSCKGSWDYPDFDHSANLTPRSLGTDPGFHLHMSLV